MKEIMLSQGRVALVDDNDFEWLNKFKWYFGWNGYAIRSVKGGNKKVSMHRTILLTSCDNKGIQVDHINRNKLDNRRANLRKCSLIENRFNQSKGRNNTSSFKGVCRHNQGKITTYKAYMYRKNKQHHLGVFSDIIKAAQTYDKAVLKYYGEFAAFNFPIEVELGRILGGKL